MPTKMPANQDEKRTERGTWRKGVSGNPAGLKVGVKHFRTRLLEHLDQDAFAAQLVRLATEEQYPWAIALLVERLWPKRIDLDVDVDIDAESRYQGPYLAPFTSSDQASASRGESATNAELVEMVRDTQERDT